MLRIEFEMQNWDKFWKEFVKKDRLRILLNEEKEVSNFLFNSKILKVKTKEINERKIWDEDQEDIDECHYIQTIITFKIKNEVYKIKNRDGYMKTKYDIIWIEDWEMKNIEDEDYKELKYYKKTDAKIMNYLDEFRDEVIEPRDSNAHDWEWEVEKREKEKVYGKRKK